MNMYFVYADGHIVTPETGTILEGITRSAIIELAQKKGHKVEERKFSIDEWRDGVASGEITEVFACGTAAVVTPVGTLKWDGGEVAGRSHRRGRPADHGDPAGPGRHPVRPRRRRVRLDAPGLLTRRRCHGYRGAVTLSPIRWSSPATVVRVTTSAQPHPARPWSAPTGCSRRSARAAWAWSTSPRGRTASGSR